MSCLVLQVRTLVQQALNGALQQYNLLLSPVAPTTAFKIGEKSEDPLSMYKEDLMTVHLNLAGIQPGTLANLVRLASSMLTFCWRTKQHPAYGKTSW